MPLVKRRQEGSPRNDPNLLNQNGFFVTVQMCLNPKDQDMQSTDSNKCCGLGLGWVSVLNGSSMPVNAGFMKTVLLTVSWTAVAKRGYAPSVLS